MLNNIIALGNKENKKILNANCGNIIRDEFLIHQHLQ